MFRAQSFIEYALLIATVALLTLLGGIFFGNALHRWLIDLALRITATARLP